MDARLKAELDRFLGSVEPAVLVRNDPVELVRRYDRPDDQEVVGLLVAGLAYGRASVVRDRASALLERLGPRPAETLGRRGGAERLQGFVYRFQRGSDLPRFARALAKERAEAGSLAAAFRAACREAPDPDNAPWVSAMGHFVGRLRRHLPRPAGPGLRYLLPSPETGAAKRLALYLRWMVRADDGMDLGTWGGPTHRLVIPLDTHIARIGRYVGLTRRQTPNLATALDITASLARLEPRDPLRYDMALCHLGISGACPTRREPAICQSCPVQRICQLP